MSVGCKGSTTVWVCVDGGVGGEDLDVGSKTIPPTIVSDLGRPNSSLGSKVENDQHCETRSMN